MDPTQHPAYIAQLNKLYSTPELETYYKPFVAEFLQNNLDDMFITFVPSIKIVLRDILFTLNITPLEAIPSITDDPGIWLKNIVDNFDNPQFMYDWFNSEFFNNESVLPKQTNRVKSTDIESIITDFVTIVAHQPHIVEELQQSTKLISKTEVD